MNYARQMVNYKPAKRGLGNSPFILDIIEKWPSSHAIKTPCVKDKDLTP